MENLERALRVNTLAIPAIALIAGIVAADSCDARWWIGLIAVVAGVLVFLALSQLSKNPVQSYRSRHWHYAWLALIFFGEGIIVSDLHAPTPLPGNMVNEPVAISGLVTAKEIREQGEIVTLRVSRVTNRKGESFVPSGLLIRTKSELTDADVDSQVKLSATLQPIASSSNSFNTSYPERMRRQGILYNADLTGEIRETGHTTTLAGIAHTLRERIESRIERTPLSTPVKHFFISILLGDREYLSPDTRDTFASTGTAHILALSGMHIAIIASIFMFILFPLNFAGRYKLRLIITAVCIWLYAIVSGMSPSTVRACIMYSFFAAAAVMERHNSPFNSLFGAALLIATLWPGAVFDTGFILSFLCVGSLIAFAPGLNPMDQKKRLLYNGAATVIATLTATFATWAVTAYYFGTLPLNFFLPNLVLLPLLPLYVSAAIVYFTFFTFGVELALLGRCVEGIYNFTTGWLASAGADIMIELYVPAAAVALWVAALTVMALYLNVGRHRALAIGSAALATAAIVSIAVTRPEFPAGSCIIGSSFNTIPLTIKGGTSETRSEIPPHSVSKVNVGGHRLVFVDKRETSPGDADSERCHYLIIGGNNRDRLDSLLVRFHPGSIVLHNSLKRKQEENLKMQADSLRLKVHSIRHNGPLRIKAIEMQ